jgi:hypothetical protein
VSRFSVFCLLLMIGQLPAARLAQAQAQAGPGYSLRALDGVDRLGPHFTMLQGPNGDSAFGFFYVEDEGALYSGFCYPKCSMSARLTHGADRGRFVSADKRIALNNRPFVAFYNADSGDLEAIDCRDPGCSSADSRILETVGDVGAGTATTIDPVSGLPHIAYYDVSNGDLRLYRCITPRCESGSSVMVDSEGDSGRAPVARFFQGRLLIAYQRDGEVWLASSESPFVGYSTVRLAVGSAPTLVEWNGVAEIVFSGASGALERRRCNNAACAAPFDPGALTLDAGSGGAPSAHVLADERLFVSHRAATGDLMGLICADSACASSRKFLLQPGADVGQRSHAMGFADGRPLAFFDGSDHTLRSSHCTSQECVSVSRGISSNGVDAGFPRLALRSDGRAVAIWMRARRPRMALCGDAECSVVTIREAPQAPDSFASPPSIAIRPDGRPFAFYSYFGGYLVWDCADAECSSSTLREVGASGNPNGGSTELAIRADGRPLLAYLSTQSDGRVVRVFSCTDSNCSIGSEHLVADESADSTIILGLNMVLGTDGRALLAWNRIQGSLRLAQCADPDCSSASVRSLNASPTFGRVPIAVRSDGRPVLLEQLSQERNLLTCDTPACLSLARSPLPNPFDGVEALVLDAKQRPVYSSGTIGHGGYWQCVDAACSSAQRHIIISDGGAPNRGFRGPLALDPKGRPVLLFREQDLEDVWLLTPKGDAVFKDGFED